LVSTVTTVITVITLHICRPRGADIVTPYVTTTVTSHLLVILNL
jgi:hypothetical protein